MPDKKEEVKEETPAPSESSTEKKESKEPQEAPGKNTDLEEIKKEYEGQLQKEVGEKENLKKALSEERDRRKKAEATPPTQPSESQGGEIPDWFLKREQDRFKKEKVKALDEFVKDNPNLQSENDLNDANWTKFQSTIERYGFKGESKEEIKEELGGFYRMTFPEVTQTQPPTQVVEDSGVGETATQLKTKEEVPDIMTRSLNKYEKVAAENFPGGEKAWRQARAERLKGETEKKNE